MDSTIMFSIKDLLMFILWGLLVGIFVYLIFILRRALKIVKQVNGIVDDNRQNIDNIIDVVPGLTKNVEDITGEISYDVSQFRGTVENISTSTESVTETMKDNQSFMDGISSVMHTVAIGKSIYDRYFGEKVDEVKDIVSAVERDIAKDLANK